MRVIQMVDKRKLDKWQREVLKLENRADKKAERKLWSIYNNVLKETQAKIKDYLEEFDKLPEYKKAQLYGLQRLEKEVVDILNAAYPESKKVILDYKTMASVDGYYQQIYQAQQGMVTGLKFDGIDKDFIAQAVNSPVNGKTLSNRLYKSRKKLARHATSIITSGVSQGLGYGQIAQRMRAATEASLYQSLRIARTEGGRLRSQSRQKAQEELIERGFEVKKMWMSALDTRVRSSHAHLDGQIVGVDEEFTSPTGATAKAPRLFGVASEDINCRCTVVTIIDDAKPELRRDGEGKVTKYRNYSQWAKANGVKY